VQNLSIAAGKKYYFGVRAVSKTKGASIETKSDGAVVATPTGDGDGGFIDEDAGVPTPDAGDPKGGGGPESGCGCRTAGDEGTPPGCGRWRRCLRWGRAGGPSVARDDGLGAARAVDLRFKLAREAGTRRASGPRSWMRRGFLARLAILVPPPSLEAGRPIMTP